MLLHSVSSCDIPGCAHYPDGSCVFAMCLCREGIADGQADFDFAKRSDSTLKEMEGALGGLRVASGDQHEKALKHRLEQV